MNTYSTDAVIVAFAMLGATVFCAFVWACIEIGYEIYKEDEDRKYADWKTKERRIKGDEFKGAMRERFDDEY